MGEQLAVDPVLTKAPLVPAPRPPRFRRRRVLIGDARGNGRFLRATWHAEGRMFVVSTWNDVDVCTGAVRVPVDQAADLVNLLADGMAEALGASPVERARRSPVASAQQQIRSVQARFFGWLRSGTARATTALRAREVSADAKVHQHRRRSGL